jgi:hypothetical protein
MPKRSSSRDANQSAFATVQAVTGAQGPFVVVPPAELAKNPAAVALGRLGGLKGGKARAASLTKKERSEIAKKAAKARWETKSP